MRELMEGALAARGRWLTIAARAPYIDGGLTGMRG
jgi:hypothetical protein